jgi:hypothetical protein
LYLKILVTIILIFILQFCFTQNIQVSDGFVFDGEPYIVINPANSSHLVTAWMGFQPAQKITIKTSVSTDGGINWSSAGWIPHQLAGNSSADVSMSFDNYGNLFMSYIDYDNVSFSNGSVYIRKSTDGGATWGEASEVISIVDCPGKLCIDRPWMVVDNSGGTYDGTIYITTQNADQPTMVSPPYNPYITVSSDHGVSFQPSRLLDTLGFYAGNSIKQPMASPTVNSTGTFYALYPSYEPINQGPFGHLMLASSQNGGTTINHIDAYTISNGGTTNSYLKSGPLLKTDPSDPNHLAYFFVSETEGDADIFYIESFNAGLNWSNPFRVNQDPAGNGKIQDLVWADFDTDGDVGICWRDRRNALGNTYQEQTEIYCAVRKKDSVTFLSDFAITDNPIGHDTILDGKGNDFMCLRFLHDTIYAVWGDVRTGNLSIYLNKSSIVTGTNSIQLISREAINPIHIYPNPVSETLFIQTDLTPVSYHIFDVLGNEIMSGAQISEQGLYIGHIPTGNYTLLLQYDEFVQSIDFIKK